MRQRRQNSGPVSGHCRGPMPVRPGGMAAHAPPPVCAHGNARGYARWLQIPLASLLTLAGLMLASHLLDPCTTSGDSCSNPPDAAHLGQVAPVQTMPEPSFTPPAAATGIEPGSVLRHALTPLPLGMDGNASVTYQLPPGTPMLDMATHRAAIALDQINLIAVIQRDGTRTALVRLPDGRILRLLPGDALQGGTVAAISENALYLLAPDMTPHAFVLGG